MLEITSVKNGIVIDHIEAGKGVKVFNYLGLDKIDENVALIINANSNKIGKKDIVKIENFYDVDYMVLGLISPSITICEVKEGKIVNKIYPELPEKVEDVIECKNPNCITCVEKYVPQSFVLVDRKSAKYKCEYCDNTTSL